MFLLPLTAYLMAMFLEERGGLALTFPPIRALPRSSHPRSRLRSPWSSCSPTTVASSIIQRILSTISADLHHTNLNHTLASCATVTQQSSGSSYLRSAHSAALHPASFTAVPRFVLPALARLLLPAHGAPIWFPPHTSFPILMLGSPSAFVPQFVFRALLWSLSTLELHNCCSMFDLFPSAPCVPGAPAVLFPYTGPAPKGQCDIVQHVTLMRCQCPELVAARLACSLSARKYLISIATGSQGRREARVTDRSKKGQSRTGLAFMPGGRSPRPNPPP